MRLPRPRGPLSHALVELLCTGASSEAVLPARASDASGSDRAIALWTVHELHYRGFEEVDERWEWHPALAPLRHDLESDLEARLRARWTDARPAVRAVRAATPPTADGATDVADELEALVRADDGPSLARHVQRRASHEQVLQLLRQRSIYHLKEADPTSWVVPRLEADPKAALLQVQFDEYGVGDPSRLHHELFAVGMAESGLDRRYGAYIDEALPEVLEQNNALSLFGLHRRLRGAALGHLAAFEATSSVPSRQLAQGLERLGFPAAMVAYYDEHVEADAVHEQLAFWDICGRLVEREPPLYDDVLMGAWTCLDLEARSAEAVLDLWSAAA